MSTKQSLIRKIRKSKEYRDEFVAAQISTGIPFQIRALRKAQNWTQAKLAEATQMAQPRICAMEQAGYGEFTLNTLRKLASAFDVGLVVRFAPFGEVVNWADSFSPDTFSVAVSEDDPVLNTRESGAEMRPIQSGTSTVTSQLNQAGQAEITEISALLRDATMESTYVSHYRSLREPNEPRLGGAAMAATALRATG